MSNPSNRASMRGQLTLRGVIIGSGGYSAFFLLIGALLPALGIPLSYLLAALAAISVGALTFYRTRKRP